VDITGEKIAKNQHLGEGRKYQLDLNSYKGKMKRDIRNKAEGNFEHPVHFKGNEQCFVRGGKHERYNPKGNFFIQSQEGK